MTKHMLKAVLTLVFMASGSTFALDQALWNDLIRDALAKGEEKPFMDLTAFSFKQGTTFDVTQERSVRYFTVAGRKGLDGTVVPFMASIVEEEWTRVDGVWRVDQWLRGIYMNGTLKSVTHNIHMITDTHRVLKSDSESFSPASPAQIEALETKLVEWAGFAKAASGLRLPFSN